MKTVALDLNGMTCGGGAACVRKALGALPGVTAVSVLSTTNKSKSSVTNVERASNMRRASAAAHRRCRRITQDHAFDLRQAGSRPGSIGFVAS